MTAGRLQNKNAIVTGGAGGIGRATALALAAEGASVAVVDLHASGAVLARTTSAPTAPARTAPST